MPQLVAATMSCRDFNRKRQVESYSVFSQLALTAHVCKAVLWDVVTCRVQAPWNLTGSAGGSWLSALQQFQDGIGKFLLRAPSRLADPPDTWC